MHAIVKSWRADRTSAKRVSDRLVAMVKDNAASKAGHADSAIPASVFEGVLAAEWIPLATAFNDCRASR